MFGVWVPRVRPAHDRCDVWRNYANFNSRARIFLIFFLFFFVCYYITIRECELSLILSDEKSRRGLVVISISLRVTSLRLLVPSRFVSQLSWNEFVNRGVAVSIRAQSGPTERCSPFMHLYAEFLAEYLSLLAVAQNSLYLSLSWFIASLPRLLHWRSRIEFL